MRVNRRWRSRAGCGVPGSRRKPKHNEHTDAAKRPGLPRFRQIEAHQCREAFAMRRFEASGVIERASHQHRSFEAGNDHPRLIPCRSFKAKAAEGPSVLRNGLQPRLVEIEEPSTASRIANWVESGLYSAANIPQRHIRYLRNTSQYRST